MKNRKLIKAAALLAAGLLSAATMFAQKSFTVTGTVTDEGGNSLAGVFVCATGSTVATSTDAQGAFSFSIPSSTESLTFSMLGMIDQTVAVAGQSNFKVVMKEDTQTLEETVVVGYGTMIRKELSTSVASVKSDALTERATSFNVLQGMAGKMAGVSISSTSGRPGGHSFMRIRGKGSINASSEPLYVMDGIVDIDPEMINPSDIETIDVLKDAAATAMYGAKGANGVVLITTKSGKKGEGMVTFDATYGQGWVTRTYDLISSNEYLQYIRDSYAYSGRTMTYFTEPDETLFNYAKDADGNYLYDDQGLLIPSAKYDTDWQSVIYKPSVIQNYNLSFSNADERNSVYASIGYKDMQGNTVNSGSKRLSGNVNFKSKINNWLDVQASASISSQYLNNSDNEMDAGLGSTLMSYALDIAPIIPYQYEDGTYGKAADYALGDTFDSLQKIIDSMKRTTKQTYAVFNVAANIHFTKNLTLTVKGDAQVSNTEKDYSVASGVIGLSQTSGGEASISKTTTRRAGNEDYLTYENMFFDGRLKSNFVGGFSAYYYDYNYSFSGSSNYYDSSFEHYNLGVGTVYTQPSSSYDKRTMASFYFRTNQSWEGKYMLGLTVRADGASNLGNNSKWGVFPSASGAWAMSEEPWFQGAKNVINHLKLRLSYGLVGNSSLDSYKTFSQYANGKTVLGNQQVANVTLSNLGNQDLCWETTAQWDAGLDLSFFHDRLQFITDFYDKNTTGLLFNMQVPVTTGYSTSATNLGKLNNRGFELTVNAHTIDNKEFKWDTDFVFSTNRTMCIDLNGQIINPGSGQYSQEGREWGLWRSYNRLGVWQLDEVEEAAKYGFHPGDPKYEDVNNDGQYTEADYCDGLRSTPKYEFSLVNTFYWKGFSLMVDLGAKTGFWVSSSIANFTYALSGNLPVTTIRDAWTPENQNTWIPAVRTRSDFEGIKSDNYCYYKGDFLRLRNVGLSYDFKRDVFKNCKFIKGLTFGVNGENLFLWTKYPGYDTEVSGLGINDGFYGWGSANVYPKPLVVTGNIKITF